MRRRRHTASAQTFANGSVLDADRLGPWPHRLLFIAAIAAEAMAVAILPWIGRRDRALDRAARPGYQNSGAVAANAPSVT